MRNQVLVCHDFSAQQLSSLRYLIRNTDPEMSDSVAVSAATVMDKNVLGLHLHNYTSPSLIEKLSASAKDRPKKQGAFKIAVVTGSPDLRAKIYRRGYSDYLIFPFVADEIAYRVKSAFAEIQMASETFIYSKDSLVERACVFLSNNMDQNISLRQIVEFCGTNRNSLNTRFSKSLGMSPIAWHRHKRIKNASRLLRDTDESISDIAHQFGFDDANNFSTLFKKQLGHSPRVYRNMK